MRLQDVVTKEFKLLGTITSLRIADNGAEVSYKIVTDQGYHTTRHRRFLRPHAAEHDPQINKNISKSRKLGKTEIPTNLETMSNDDTANDYTADVTEKEVGNYSAGPMRSSRISRGRIEE